MNKEVILNNREQKRLADRHTIFQSPKVAAFAKQLEGLEPRSHLGRPQAKPKFTKPKFPLTSTYVLWYTAAMNTYDRPPQSLPTNNFSSLLDRLAEELDLDI